MPLPLAHRLLSLLLAVLVLASSAGLTVQRRTCRISGHSQVRAVLPALAVAEQARQLAPASDRIQSRCFDFSSQHHKVSPQASGFAESKSGAAVRVAALLASPRFWEAVSRPTAAISGARWFAADSSPPPRGGRALLAFAGVLVV
jgi:hypothetical protein